MADAIKGIIVAGLIPLVMLSLFAYSILLTLRAPTGSRKVSAMAGLFAGLILFSIFAATTAPTGGFTSPDLIDIPLVSWIAVLIGIPVGYCAIPATRALMREGREGVLTLLFSASGTISVFSYFSVTGAQGFTFLLALTVAFGLLIFLVFHPREHNSGEQESWSRLNVRSTRFYRWLCGLGGPTPPLGHGPETLDPNRP